MTVRILAADDEDRIRQLVRMYLTRQNFEVDAATGEPVPGVHMRLMWADTALNRKSGREPDTEVSLPLLHGFPPSDNASPQWTSEYGEYAWMVWPDGDYYLLAEKEGYLHYDSFTPPIRLVKAPWYTLCDGSEALVQGVGKR